MGKCTISARAPASGTIAVGRPALVLLRRFEKGRLYRVCGRLGPLALAALGLPNHDVYLVHATEDVGWVPAADLPQLTEKGKENFSELLSAKVTAIRPGPYGTELVLDGIDPQLLVQYDETIANYSKAEQSLGFFMGGMK